MYASYFGLKQSPFCIAPDPRYLFMSERHREALAHLLYGVQGGGGFVLLTGEIGAGKTTVCRCFLEQVPVHCQVAYIFNPKLSVIELLQSVCHEFGVGVPGDPGAATVKTCVDALSTHLLAAHAQGRHGLLIIDEAQHLSAEVLEQLRLLTNLETNERKLLQIILIGQPELRMLLAGAGMEQLAQRVIARFHLGTLSAPETAAYVAHRLAVAGLQGANPFDTAALRRIHTLTAGVPRRINLLCDRALLGAYAEGRSSVGRRIVDRAAQEVFGAGAAPAWWRRTGALALGGLAVMLVVAGWLAGQARAPEGVDRLAAAHLAGTGVASAASAATAATPSSASPYWPAFDDTSDWARLPRDEAEALRELAAQWTVILPPGPPCAQAERAQLGCWRSTAGALPLLDRLDRPVVITLADATGRVAHVRLTGLTSAGAVLAAGERHWTMPVAQLAARWRGEMITFWRMPVGYEQALAPGASGPAVAALAEGLARHGGQATPAATDRYDAALLQQVAGFQLAVGLKPDGLAGPTTFMLLNRALGLDEPRLARE